MLLDVVQLKEYCSYRDDGYLIRRYQHRQYEAGSVMGGLHASIGYWRASFAGVPYLVHQLVYGYHHGYIPEIIDHKNTIRSDNRIENLREASRSVNSQNCKKRGGASIFSGVTYECHSWRARIMVDGKRKHLGMFSTELEAATAYDVAALQYFGTDCALNLAVTHV